MLQHDTYARLSKDLTARVETKITRSLKTLEGRGLTGGTMTHVWNSSEFVQGDECTRMKTSAKWTSLLAAQYYWADLQTSCTATYRVKHVDTGSQL